MTDEIRLGDRVVYCGPGCQKSDKPELRKWLYHALSCPDAPKPAEPSEAPAEEGRIYPCDNCDKMRTKEEGGTIFSVCEACWDKIHGKPAPAPEPKQGSEKPIPEEAIHIAAQCWCDPETSNRVMDTVLATAFAKRIAPYLALRAENEELKTNSYSDQAFEALRAELAAADQNLKTMLQAAGEEAERQLAEKDKELAAAREEIAKLTRERDLAITHDRQPYPTAWAYEQACKALAAEKARADRAEEERDDILAECAAQWINAGPIPRWMVNRGLEIIEARPRKEGGSR